LCAAMWFPARWARAHCQAFFSWYNDAHRHSGLGLQMFRREWLTLAQGQADFGPAPDQSAVLTSACTVAPDHVVARVLPRAWQGDSRHIGRRRRASVLALLPAAISDSSPVLSPPTSACG